MFERHPILDDRLNLTFDEVVFMSNRSFTNYAIKLRRFLTDRWTNELIPPNKGTSVESIIRSFKGLIEFDTERLIATDELTYKQDCIMNERCRFGSAASEFFPVMGYMEDSDTGASLFNLLANDNRKEQCIRLFDRNIKRDSHYKFSPPLKRNDERSNAKTASEFLESYSPDSEYDFWIAPIVDKKKQRLFLTLDSKQLKALVSSDILDKKRIQTLSLSDGDNESIYQIRVFKKGQKLFPACFNILRTAGQIMGTNFPSATAKYLYQKYTKHLTEQDRILIYDPSAGYGGRLLGAIAAGTDRNIHYIGTDPNSLLRRNDVWMHQEMAEFFNNNFPNTSRTTYELFPLGSEVIHQDKEFKKYKGKFDLVFTSPPYFSAEIYSNDPTQSAVKFSEYDEWVDGFLKKTLKTAADWLKSGGYFIWNIADTGAKSGGLVPLENISVQILKSLGLIYEDKLKMVLARSPGAGRTHRWRYPTFKNFVRVGGADRKYEPIFVFRKP